MTTRAALAVALVLALTGCATPVTMMKNDKTGQVARCGGGNSGALAWGLIGYNVEKNADEKCVADYESQGFKRL